MWAFATLFTLLLTYSTFAWAAQVDLGYAIYQSNPNPPIQNYTVYNGIKYGSAPRFGVATTPATNRTVQVANKNVTVCYQGLPGTPASIQAAISISSEDCLLLDVWVPSTSSSNNGGAGLPVIFNIHGGSYYYASKNNFAPNTFASFAPSPFIFVSINYRLGAFGFLGSSDYVANGGNLNAGLKDQQLALQWVQQYISKFGGDPRQVTVFGESAGGGSVLQQSIASGNKGLFKRVLAASPYLPPQPHAGSPLLNKYYSDLATAVNCTTKSVFACLKKVSGADIAVAQTNLVTQLMAATALPAFIPCVDGKFITDTPTKLLALQQIPFGVSGLVGTNTNEGVTFLPSPNITTSQQVASFASQIWQGFNKIKINELLSLYPDPKTNVTTYDSQAGRLASMYSDAIFRCPANLLADSYNAKFGNQGHRYQFNVEPGLHAQDLQYYYGLSVYPSLQLPVFPEVQKDFVSALTTFMLRGDFTLDGRQGAKYFNGVMASFQPASIQVQKDVPIFGDVVPVDYAATGSSITKVNTQFKSPNGFDLCAFWIANFPNYWPE